MFDGIIMWLFRLAGRGKIARFMTSIRHLGSRGDIVGSTLLFDQGAWILSSGANTTVAMQTSGRFVLPYWLERQWDPASSSFLPTGAGLLTCNLTHRNWTSIGIPGIPYEIMVDPVGMITAQILGGSFFPYLICGGRKIMAPRDTQAQQHFCKNTRQVITRYSDCSGLRFESRVSTGPWENDVCALMEIELQNETELTTECCFGIALRPYNTLAVSHIDSLYRQSEACLDVNGKASLIALTKPNRVIAGNLSHGDPLSDEAGFIFEVGQKLISRSGVIFANVEYQRKVDPKQKIVFRFVLPNAASHPYRESVFARSTLPSDFERRIEDGLSIIKKYEENSAQFTFSDPQLQYLVNSAKAHIGAFDDGDNFAPGTFLYHHSWLRDGYFLTQAAMNFGLWSGMKRKCQKILLNQSRSGLFANAPAEWDGNGQALSLIVDFCRKSGDADFLEKSYPSLKKGAQYIYRQYKKELKKKAPHSGLLPMGFSAEHLGTIDSYFWDAMWALQGIRDTIFAATHLNKSSDAEEMLVWEHSLTVGLTDTIARTLQKLDRNILPATPYRRPDAACIGCLAACDPLELDNILEPWLESTLEFLLKEFTHDGLFFHAVFHTGLNPYLSVQLARTLLARGDSRCLSILWALMNFASPTATWPEAINPLTKGGCMGDGHHGWSNAEFLNIVRNILIFERHDSMYLGHGIDINWIQKNGNTSVSNAPTRAGNTSFACHSENGIIKISWNIEPNIFASKTKIFLSLPIPPDGHEKQTRMGERFIKHVSMNGSLEIKLQNTKGEGGRVS